ncbi:hypothetical protein GCK72_023245 [Caenorhabditis remanei]|uniref:Putative alpha-L-fucosidase n=1 Tax=Caenorhabditis remanei TaxID=31234 RepID=A0A6A5FVY5_CAERE|nr:hypothetical protein GCK72_023245 [Caenorhabditis remanei]KAF1746788.1 hypothetical protein GCK72_023245 [Caenorhabditis remanei]
MMFFIVLLIFLPLSNADYTPDWDSLDKRALPRWYDASKFGIFMHWGAYSVPALKSEWMWWKWKGTNPDPEVVEFMEKNYQPGFSYADFATQFRAEYFNASRFAEVVQKAGAKYFVFTSKHHEGYTMYPSKYSWNWNSVDVGPKRDIVGELKQAFSQTDIHFGLYFSQFEFFHPMFLEDEKKNTTTYPENISYPQMIEIVEKYEPEVIWSDGDWGKTDIYWKSKDFLAWLYNSSPVKDKVVVNDRWGVNTSGLHGGFMTYADNYDPKVILGVKWESCDMMDTHSWGHRRNMRPEEIRTSYEIIEKLARTIACNGNLLLNIGPDMHGLIPPIFEERLAEVGKFLELNGKAVYGTIPWLYQNDSSTWYTSSHKFQYKSGHPSNIVHENTDFNSQKKDKTVIYAFVLDTNKDVFEFPSIKTTKETNLRRYISHMKKLRERKIVKEVNRRGY